MTLPSKCRWRADDITCPPGELVCTKDATQGGSSAFPSACGKLAQCRSSCCPSLTALALRSEVSVAWLCRATRLRLCLPLSANYCALMGYCRRGKSFFRRLKKLKSKPDGSGPKKGTGGGKTKSPDKIRRRHDLAFPRRLALASPASDAAAIDPSVDPADHAIATLTNGNLRQLNWVANKFAERYAARHRESVDQTTSPDRVFRARSNWLVKRIAAEENCAKGNKGGAKKANGRALPMNRPKFSPFAPDETTPVRVKRERSPSPSCASERSLDAACEDGGESGLPFSGEHTPYLTRRYFGEW